MQVAQPSQPSQPRPPAEVLVCKSTTDTWQERADVDLHMANALKCQQKNIGPNMPQPNHHDTKSMTKTLLCYVLICPDVLPPKGFKASRKQSHAES
jgi:hypothetical protein